VNIMWPFKRKDDDPIIVTEPKYKYVIFPVEIKQKGERPFTYNEKIELNNHMTLEHIKEIIPTMLDVLRTELLNAKSIKPVIDSVDYVKPILKEDIQAIKIWKDAWRVE